MTDNIAWLDNVHEIILETNVDMKMNVNDEPIIVSEIENKHFPAKISQFINQNQIILKTIDELPIGESIYLKWGNLHAPIYPRKIVRTKWFEDNYCPPLDFELGPNCMKNAASFTIWAPTASNASVLLNNCKYPLSRKKFGIWTAMIEGSWHGYDYEFEITVNGKTFLVNDPYAKSLIANSEKAVLIDFSKSEQMQFPRPKLHSLQDSIIYELHIRDASIHNDSGVTHPGKYLGMAELNTSTKNGYSTCLSYIKELGITHIELLPINDFARIDDINSGKSYNWGYDPLFYQAPEGSYSTKPENPLTKINECKKMIDTIHKEGLSVILDVVFNHIFIEIDISETIFEKIVPGYYFRFCQDGTVSNGTGVGNDLATERKMVRKLILDSVDFWLKQYKVDGFRFDLMGAIDLETMQLIRKRCEEESEKILLLGEGWDLPTSLPNEQKATAENARKLKGIRFFNDFFRDTLKGPLFDSQSKGYVNGNGQYIERLASLVSGSCVEEFGHTFIQDPCQTINYVECHDNHTLWDRLLITNRNDDELSRKRMHQLATGITLLSQGVPFIHAGQEFFRTKKLVENSYNSSDEINQLNWNQREVEEESIQFVRNLIKLRKSDEVFRLTSKKEIKQRLHLLKTPYPVFGYTLLGDENDYTIYVNPTNESYNLNLPSSGIWQLVISNVINQMPSKEIIGEFSQISPYEFLVYKKLKTNK